MSDTKTPIIDSVEPQPSAASNQRELTSGSEKDRQPAGQRAELNEKVRDEKPDPYAGINGGVALPYELVRRGETPKLTFADLKRAYEEGSWPNVVKTAFSLFFKKGNEVKALGYFTEGLEKLPASGRMRVLEQMERADQKGMSHMDKMKTALLRSEAALLAAKDGLKKTGELVPSGAPVKIGENRRLADIINPEAWKEIRERKIIGPLDTDEVLPAGAYLHLTSEGYPVGITAGENENPPAAGIYVQDEAEKKIAGKNRKEQRINWLQSRLKKGDILFVNRNSKDMKASDRFFVGMARILQAQKSEEEGFFAIHAIVYIGDGKVRHMLMSGAQETTFAALFEKRYDSVAVARIPDESKAAKLADKAREFTDFKPEYDKKLAKHALFLLKRRIAAEKGEPVPSTPVTTKQAECICTDVVNYAGNQLDIAELKDAETVMDMVRELKIEYAMNLTDEPVRLAGDSRGGASMEAPETLAA